MPDNVETESTSTGPDIETANPVNNETPNQVDEGTSSKEPVDNDTSAPTDLAIPPAAPGDHGSVDKETTKQIDEATSSEEPVDNDTSAPTDLAIPPAAPGDHESVDKETPKQVDEATSSEKPVDNDSSAPADRAIPPAAPGDHESEAAKASQLGKIIVRQIEYYFGDYSYPRDRFLQENAKENNGWVSMDKMLKFNRLARISSDADFILSSLKESCSEIVEIDIEGKRIRRSPNCPIPEVNEETKKELIKKTVYGKGFLKEDTSLDQLIEFFASYEGVVNVNRRTYLDKKDDKRRFKGSVFVSFKDVEKAGNFMSLASVRIPKHMAEGGEEVELIRKWQADYFQEKDALFEEKKKLRLETKQNTKKAKQAAKADMADDAPASKEEDDLPLGAVLDLEGFTDPEMRREDIKEKLKQDYDVDDDAFAFICFQKGETKAQLRFKHTNFAKELVQKINEKLENSENGDHQINIKGQKVGYKVLEGEDEAEFLSKCKKEIMEKRTKTRGHKRRGNGFHCGRGKRARKL